jgi:hypothetical protein
LVLSAVSRSHVSRFGTPFLIFYVEQHIKGLMLPPWLCGIELRNGPFPPIGHRSNVPSSNGFRLVEELLLGGNPESFFPRRHANDVRWEPHDVR